MFDLENKSIQVTRISLDFEGFSRKPYVSYKLKICFVNAGGGTWQIGNRLHTVEQGDIILLNNRQERVFREVSPDNGIDLIVVEFEPQFIFSTRFYALFFSGNENFNCKVSGNTEIGKLIKEMEQEATGKLMNHRIMMGAKLIEILSLLERHYNITNSENLKYREEMYKVLEYINENYTSHISLDKAAQLLHMSATSFSKCFSRAMGVGFAQYVMGKRINHAIYLLQTSDKTVLEIALDCGFNNPASFYKAFKKVTNKIPNDYRDLKGNYYI